MSFHPDSFVFPFPPLIPITPAEIAKLRLRWVIRADRKAVPTGRWVCVTSPMGPGHLQRIIDRYLPSGQPFMRSLLWRKPRYRWEVRR